VVSIGEQLLYRIVTSYRAYMLNEHGKIFRGDDVEAPDDAAAIAAGRALRDAPDSDPADGFEIWRGSALIFSSRSGSV
jgi:hypothetical protein